VDKELNPAVLEAPEEKHHEVILLVLKYDFLMAV
jgi:hypothetical protein